MKAAAMKKAVPMKAMKAVAKKKAAAMKAAVAKEKAAAMKAVAKKKAATMKAVPMKATKAAADVERPKFKVLMGCCKLALAWDLYHRALMDRPSQSPNHLPVTSAADRLICPEPETTADVTPEALNW